jgi:glyoxylase-like metal-dependent hydrolase (beta-lactamase superfamily II)
VADGLYALRVTMVNMFVIRRGDTVIALDAAMSPGRLAREWRKLPIGPEAVQALFLTHADPDHVGGLGLMPNAQVYVGLGVPRAALPRTMFSLADGETVRIGDVTVRAIATPGHRVGSTSYVVDGRWLFTGDSLALRQGQVTAFVHLLNDDTAAQRRSIRRLATLPDIELVCTAHSGVCRAWQQATAAWRASLP